MSTLQTLQDTHSSGCLGAAVVQFIYKCIQVITNISLFYCKLVSMGTSIMSDMLLLIS